jgi:hypothetical protein
MIDISGGFKQVSLPRDFAQKSSENLNLLQYSTVATTTWLTTMEYL